VAVVTYGLRRRKAMARQVKVAATRRGPINEGPSREEIVDRPEMVKS
jgi:hypothetical protein